MRDRDRQTDRDGQTETQRDAHRETEREIETNRDRDRQTNRNRDYGEREREFRITGLFVCKLLINHTLFRRW